jgi:ABC-type dipeptide/oligopeptide/nickel transport system ATPase component
VSSTGYISYRGEDLLRASSKRLRTLRGDRIGYIAQDPSVALDPLFTVGAQLIETLREHRTITLIYAGQIVELGLVTELLARPRHPYTQRLLNAVPVPGKIWEQQNTVHKRGKI